MDGDPTIWKRENAWIFSEEFFLNRTPSRLKGIPYDEETRAIQNLCSMVKELGHKIEVSQLCTNTAQVYIRRFFTQIDLKRFNKQNVAACCLFLAAKVEEKPRKLEHVILQKVRLTGFTFTAGMKEKSPQEKEAMEVAAFTEEFKTLENVILKVLGFSLTIDHPHSHVVRACQLFNASADFAQTAYFMASNVLMLTNLCLELSSVDLAAVSIYTAIKWARYPMFTSKEGVEWFKYMNESLTEERLKGIVDRLMMTIQGCPERLKQSLRLRRGTDDRRGRGPADAAQQVPRDAQAPREADGSGQRQQPSGSSTSQQPQPGPSGASTSQQPQPGPSRAPSSHSHRSSEPSRQHHSSSAAPHHHPGGPSTSTARLRHGPSTDTPKRPDGRSMAAPSGAGDAANVCRVAPQAQTSTHSAPSSSSSLSRVNPTNRQEPRADSRSRPPMHPPRQDGEPPVKKSLSLSDYQRRNEQRPPPPNVPKKEHSPSMRMQMHPPSRRPPSPPQLPHANSVPPQHHHGQQGLQTHPVPKRPSNHPQPQNIRESRPLKRPHGHMEQVPNSSSSRQPPQTEDVAQPHPHYKDPKASSSRQSRPSNQQGSSVKNINKDGVISSVPGNVHLKEAMVMVHDLKDSQGQDHVLFTNAEASRKRSLSQSQEDDSFRQAGSQQSSVPDNPRPETNTSGSSGSESLKIRIKCNAGTLHVKSASNSEGPTATATPSPNASELKMKIRVNSETSSGRSSSSSSRLSEQAEGLKLRLPVHGSSGRGHERRDQQSGQSSGSHERRHRHGSRAHGSSSSQGQDSRKSKKKKSRRRSPYTSQSGQPPMDTDSDDGDEEEEGNRGELENGPRQHPPYQTQNSGFTFNDTLETLPEMMFQPDTPTDLNGGGFGPPETPTPENAAQVHAHMLHLMAGQHMQSFQPPPPPPLPHNQAMMMNTMYVQPVQPPLPPPLPANPPPPPPPPPQ